MKKCCSCKTEKDLKDFCVNRSSLDGRNARCRTCCSLNRVRAQERKVIKIQTCPASSETTYNFVISFEERCPTKSCQLPQLWRKLFSNIPYLYVSLFGVLTVMPVTNMDLTHITVPQQGRVTSVGKITTLCSDVVHLMTSFSRCIYNLF